jgi:hypothetical protein
MGELQSLCSDCHRLKLGEQRRGFWLGCDETGMPLDKRHPVYGR